MSHRSPQSRPEFEAPSLQRLEGQVDPVSLGAGSGQHRYLLEEFQQAWQVVSQPVPRNPLPPPPPSPFLLDLFGQPLQTLTPCGQAFVASGSRQDIHRSQVGGRREVRAGQYLP
jgi:hypothetical protein